MLSANVTVWKGNLFNIVSCTMEKIFFVKGNVCGDITLK
jgi:hypothetical protein